MEATAVDAWIAVGVALWACAFLLMLKRTSRLAARPKHWTDLPHEIELVGGPDDGLVVYADKFIGVWPVRQGPHEYRHYATTRYDDLIRSVYRHRDPNVFAEE